MNLSIGDVKGEILVVSQFTLYGNCRKGNRPGFSQSAPAQIAEPFYEEFCNALRVKGLMVSTGIFGADMKVELCNDGPVTLIIDTP
jgi:D-tyrosyl-tRNA(Tyr) deacylase